MWRFFAVHRPSPDLAIFAVDVLDLTIAVGDAVDSWFKSDDPTGMAGVRLWCPTMGRNELAECMLVGADVTVCADK